MSNLYNAEKDMLQIRKRLATLDAHSKAKEFKLDNLLHVAIPGTNLKLSELFVSLVPHIIHKNVQNLKIKDDNSDVAVVINARKEGVSITALTTRDKLLWDAIIKPVKVQDMLVNFELTIITATKKTDNQKLYHIVESLHQLAIFLIDEKKVATYENPSSLQFEYLGTVFHTVNSKTKDPVQLTDLTDDLYTSGNIITGKKKSIFPFAPDKKQHKKVIVTYYGGSLMI